MFTPELLCPAGGFEKLKIAVDYGADAVYLGGQEYGLRAAAENFTLDQLAEGVDYAHQKNCKVYITLNSFFHEEDFGQFREFLEELDRIKVDAAIVSDIGVINTITEHSNIEVHLSTQASCLNQYAAEAYKDMGVKRLVLGREVSIQEAAEIKNLADIEVELFIHGSMCMAYSGQCVISNYTAGRDSNRGGCAHSCRFEYELSDPFGEKVTTTFMSSKDLNGLGLIAQYAEAGIDSVKIEGRMKSVHYASTVTKVYRKALDYYSIHKKLDQKILNDCQAELNKLSHRDYTTASLIQPAGEESVYDERNYSSDEVGVVGEILEVVGEEFALLKVRSPLTQGDSIEVITFNSENIQYPVFEMIDVLNNKIDKANPGRIIKIPFQPGIENRNVARKVVVGNE